MFATPLLAEWNPPAPHPNPMASQAHHYLVSPEELCASRTVVPIGWGEGEDGLFVSFGAPFSIASSLPLGKCEQEKKA
jgi:hypothetical protein